MFELSENNRYFFFPEPVNMGCIINGLSKLVCAHPALSLVSGDIFVFFSRGRKHIKLLCWDGDGLFCDYKWLTRGNFDPPRYSTEKGVYELDWYAFYFIMRGVTAQELRFKKHFRIAYNS